MDCRGFSIAIVFSGIAPPPRRGALKPRHQPPDGEGTRARQPRPLPLHESRLRALLPRPRLLRDRACPTASSLWRISRRVPSLPQPLREGDTGIPRRARAGFGNVALHASGPYIISNATFPSYFLPDDDTASVGHAELDLTLFAKIAAAKSPSARSRASTTR